MRVLITGAAGLIGGIVRSELAKDHELMLVDRRGGPGILRHDLRWYWDDRRRVKRLLFWRSWWERAFTGLDAVVHLAANGDPFGRWRRVGAPNVQSTLSVLDAAVRYGVPRVVFASSTWAVKALERSLAPRCYEANGPKIGSAAVARPLGWYGVAKAAEEAAGRLLVDQGSLRTFVVVRIGWRPSPGSLPASPEDHAVWVGARDLARLFRRCIEADVTGAHVVHGISAQPGSPYDRSSTHATLGWRPEEMLPISLAGKPDAGA
ncbi:MAG TPA: NAD(P)-dependent oxidoreductase [Gemmatimonadales bacterium]|jgi:nucleoside-diphosphate-sugar epimerase